MKELELELRIRNNRLKQRRLMLGINCREMAKRVGIAYVSYLALENMRLNPLSKHNGIITWREIAIRVADYWRLPPDELFPESVIKLEKSVAQRQIDGVDVAMLCMGEHTAKQVLLGNPEKMDFELKNKIDMVISSLSLREQEVLIKRFGLRGEREHTLVEIGKKFGVTQSCIGQIEAKALRLLRHPSKSKLLKVFVGD